MASIILAFPGMQEAEEIERILKKNGYSVSGICHSGAQVLAMTDRLSDGIVISGYRLSDMLYSELREYLGNGFELLLMAAPGILSESYGREIMSLATPLQVPDLIHTVNLMINSITAKRYRKKNTIRLRRQGEKTLINEAKCLLMSRNNMSEKDAHKYIQKCSMDNSTGMTETARLILSVMR